MAVITAGLFVRAPEAEFSIVIVIKLQFVPAFFGVALLALATKVTTMSVVQAVT